MRLHTGVLCLVLLTVATGARAERTLSAAAYHDKLAAMWLGQIVGNYAGRPTEGDFSSTPRGNPAETISWDFLTIDESTGGSRTQWVGDDDTVLEYMYALLLAGETAPTDAALRQTWETYVPLPSLYIANRQARWLMAADGPDLTPPQTGCLRYNMHWYAIDAQIATEAVGAMVPGLRQRAADLAGALAAVTNAGYPVHAAQFYAALYAAGAMETAADRATLERLVAGALAVVPTTSRSYTVITDVIAWYEADKAAHAIDPNDPLDWRDTRERLYYRYRTGPEAMGRYRIWIESTVNLGLTVMALLYGEGDFTETVRIAVLAGFDCDCNPATAGGLIGLIGGRAALPTVVEDYRIGVLIVTPRDTTVDAVATLLQTAAEGQVVAAGGVVTGEGAARTYYLPDADPVTPPAERPDPDGPGGLVAAVLDAGGTVTAAASRPTPSGDDDRRNPAGLIDGIVDVSYNGHLPYWTRTDTTGQAEDWYAVTFDRLVTFTGAVFHEGDIRWTNINGNPADPGGIAGGYFRALTVEVGRDGVFGEVAQLQFSEPLDPLAFFQHIALTFLPAVGDTLRLRGTTGGTERFTSIVELELDGRAAPPIGGAADADGDVDLDDFALLKTCFGRAAGSTWGEGDFDLDGDVDLDDFVILKLNFGL